MAAGSIHLQPKRIDDAQIHLDRQPVESTAYGTAVGGQHPIAGRQSGARRARARRDCPHDHR